MNWLLREMISFRCGWGGCIAWDSEMVDAFVEAFPEAKKSLIYYLIGANSCPMLNKAAARARDLGYLRPGSIGTEDARSYNQRTWARVWRITDEGWRYLRKLDPEAVASYEGRYPDTKVPR